MFLLLAHRVELEVNVVTMDEVTLNRPQMFPGFSVILLVLSVETLPVSLEVLH